MSKKDNQLTPAQADQLRERIQSVVDKGIQSSIELAQMVWESDVNMVRVDGDLKYCWQVWGHDSWETFLGKEMHLPLKTGYGLKKVWQVFYVDLVNDWNKKLVVGISKMRILTSADLNARNVESWLRKAKELTCAKLQAKINGGEERKSFAVRVTGSQATTINRAIDYVRSMHPKGDSMSRGEVLAYMAKLAREATPAARRVA